MRLSPKEKAAIVETLKLMDSNCTVYLYGSRADDSSRGGDIDLFVISEVLGFSEKISALIAIKQKIGDQKIDLLIKKHSEADADPFVQTIIKTAILIE